MNSFGFYFAGKDILDNFIGLYNRYGKNLDYIKADRAWDGTYRGTPMSSGDYWYKLTLENGRAIKGNVTLKH